MVAAMLVGEDALCRLRMPSRVSDGGGPLAADATARRHAQNSLCLHYVDGHIVENYLAQLIQSHLYDDCLIGRAIVSRGLISVSRGLISVRP